MGKWLKKLLKKIAGARACLKTIIQQNLSPSEYSDMP